MMDDISNRAECSVIQFREDYITYDVTRRGLFLDEPDTLE